MSANASVKHETSIDREPDGGGLPPETDSLDLISAATRPRRGIPRTLVGRPASLIALIWLSALVVLTIGAPVFAPYGANDQNLEATLEGPSTSHLLGTDNLGRDILSRLIFGGRVTLLGVFLATVTALLLGSALGLLAGYRRGAADSFLSAVADILMSIPVLVILLSIAAVTSRNITVLMLAVGVLLSASVFRVFRAATLETRQELFVTAAQTSGLSDLSILRRHVFPRLGALFMIQAAVVASLALVIQVGLGFLNIDVKAPDPSWGNMIAGASQTVYTTAWPLIPPTLAIAITVLAFSVIGDVAQRSRGGRGRQSGVVKKKKRRRRTGTLPQASMPPAPRSASGKTSSVAVASNEALSIRELSVSVPGPNGSQIILVDGVSINVRQGEIVGLVGESGAGKSVTARTVLGILAKGASVSGSIRYEGVEILGAAERDLAKIRGRKIAFVGQDPMVSLSPMFRVGHQIAELVRTHQGVGRKQAERLALDLLEMVKVPGPEAVARLYPHQISGGMAQRVVIAMALAGDPKMIIADEPTTALDVSVQMQILGLLQSLQRERSLAMLLVTHDWGVVADVCDRAVVMYAGQVVEEAPVADIFGRPLHPYSVALRAADPHSQRPGDRLLTIAGHVPPPGARPMGCRFAGRCEYEIAVCRAGPVALVPFGDERMVRCVRAGENGLFDHE